MHGSSELFDIESDWTIAVEYLMIRIKGFALLVIGS